MMQKIPCYHIMDAVFARYRKRRYRSVTGIVCWCMTHMERFRMDPGIGSIYGTSPYSCNVGLLSGFNVLPYIASHLLYRRLGRGFTAVVGLTLSRTTDGREVCHLNPTLFALRAQMIFPPSPALSEQLRPNFVTPPTHISPTMILSLPRLTLITSACGWSSITTISRSGLPSCICCRSRSICVSSTCIRSMRGRG